MAYTNSLYVATIAHIRDLEELQQQKKIEVDDLVEEQERYKETRDAEIKYIEQQVHNFNEEIEVKKKKILKHIEYVDAKIKCMVDGINASNHIIDIESVVSPAEDMEERKPQGLKVIV